MKSTPKLSVVFLIALSLVLIGAAVASSEPEGAWKGLGTYGRYYDPATEETFTARIVSMTKIHYDCASASAEKCYCIAFTLEGQDGKQRTVYAGPCSYLKKKGCSLVVGDTLTVTGSAVQIGGRPLVLAKVISHNGMTVRIRSDQGLHL